ncbi:N-alpha-acetyltransferase 80-like isoform X1 [Halichondria panicea]|uniref:N-alpha-acetyltransferase 80-like isoform X1 n=1 Tax=Halichondria panicea TaxID=6063 RepID=UPI00312B7A90
MDYETVVLHTRRELLEETATLLNREWPRSMAARVASLEGGVDELPCSLVLLNSGGAVVGHARLLPVAGATNAALIESVVVCQECRGCGLGRRLMEESETYCVRVGYNAMHLSTHDQQGFYHHLGYQDGPSVNGRRKCVTNLTENQTQSLLGGAAAVDSTQPETDFRPPPVDPVAPPPPTGPAPPPPPPPKLVDRTVPSQIVNWMVKQLA